MARIYCAYSRRLNERQDLVRSDLLIVKFGLSGDVEKRLDRMKHGWLIEGFGRGPALALEDDWLLVDYPGARRDERQILNQLAHLWPHAAMVARLQAEMVIRAVESGVEAAEDNLNGNGELRVMSRAAVFRPGMWKTKIGIRRRSAAAAFEQACAFLRMNLEYKANEASCAA